MVSYLLLYLVLVSYILQISYTGLFTCSSTLCWPLYLLGYLTLVSFSLLYLVLGFLPYLIPFTGLFLTPVPCVDLLSTSIPYTGLFLTPLPCAGLFNYSYTVHWSLSYSSTHCADLYSYIVTLVSYTPLFFVLVFLPTPIPYTGLFLFLYLVLDFLPNSIPNTGLVLNPLPCVGLLPTSIPNWSLSCSSTLFWSFYLLLYLTLVSFLLLYLVLVCYLLLYLTLVFLTLLYLLLVFLPNSIPCVGLFLTPLP